jgi:hypothetical protein
MSVIREAYGVIAALIERSQVLVVLRDDIDVHLEIPLQLAVFDLCLSPAFVVVEGIDGLKPAKVEVSRLFLSFDRKIRAVVSCLRIRAAEAEQTGHDAENASDAPRTWSESRVLSDSR